MKHIIFIDPLEKLVIKKDSSLMIAHELKEQGEEVFILLEDDFYIDNQQKQADIIVNNFTSKLTEDFYLDEFLLTKKTRLLVSEELVIHMRLEPPFDVKYMRNLWMLDFLSEKGVPIINSPRGILNNNEKLTCLSHHSSIHTYVGKSLSGFKKFLSDCESTGIEEIILKPMDLFQGIGVEKLSLENGHEELLNKFKGMSAKFEGAIIGQPFLKEIYEGEIRSIFFDGIEIGSIIKVPQQGSYLANIAQGASFRSIELDSNLQESCLEICEKLKKDGISFVAFDILGGLVSEANVTCPGLLVEVSKAHGKNLAAKIVELIKDSY